MHSTQTPNTAAPTLPAAFPPAAAAAAKKVAAAKRRGIRLLLALGNLWPAYKGPEEFLEQATGSAGA